MKAWFAEHAGPAIFGVLTAIAGFLGIRAVNRFDDMLTKHGETIEGHGERIVKLEEYVDARAGHSSRILALEQKAVSREDFDELRASITASIVNVGERLEAQVAAGQQSLREDVRMLEKHLLDAALERKQ